MNIPDNWYLKGSYELGDYFLEIGVSKMSKVYDNNLLYDGITSMSGKNKNNFYSLINDKWKFSIYKLENSTEISFSQFEEFILNKNKPVKKDYQYLVKFLNNL
jgi:hypothetical protein